MCRIALKSVVLTLAVLLFSPAAFAETSYLSLKGGVFLPNDDSPGLTNFKAGSGGEIAYGAKIHPNLALEVGGGYYTTEIKDNYTDTYSDAFGNLFTATPTITLIPITATLKAIIPLGTADMFVGGGGGYYHATLESTLKDNNGVVVGSVDQSHTSSALGYHVVGGVDFNLSSSLALGAEVKYFSVKPEFTIAGRSVDVEMGGTIVNGVLKLKF